MCKKHIKCNLLKGYYNAEEVPLRYRINCSQDKCCCCSCKSKDCGHCNVMMLRSKGLISDDQVKCIYAFCLAGEITKEQKISDIERSRHERPFNVLTYQQNLDKFEEDAEDKGITPFEAHLIRRVEGLSVEDLYHEEDALVDPYSEEET